MKQKIDINTWNRREHFLHFRKFDDPYFGITANIEISNLYQHAKRYNESIFIHYFHQIMRAVNEVDPFKYRIEDDSIVHYDVINASSTVGRKDGTFAFCAFAYSSDFTIFNKKCEKEIILIENSDGLGINDKTSNLDIIHYSPVPWIQFTEMKHPVLLSKDASVPRISTGKFFNENSKIMMPISVSANHALMDGFHVAQFLEVLNENILSLK